MHRFYAGPIGFLILCFCGAITAQLCCFMGKPAAAATGQEVTSIEEGSTINPGEAATHHADTLPPPSESADAKLPVYASTAATAAVDLVVEAKSRVADPAARSVQAPQTVPQNAGEAKGE